MNKKISFLKKVKLFRSYKKILKEIRTELEPKFNVRIDSAKRIYTVLNIPEDLVGESYSLKKADIDKISENFIREYTSELSKYLTSNGLAELYDVYKVDKVDKFSYLIVVGFSLFKSDKYYNNLYYKLIPSLIILSTILLFLFL
jgi:hypothetical protein